MNKYAPENVDLDGALSRGKEEWRKNSPWTYGFDALNVWEEEIFPRFLKADLKEIDIEDLRLYCPLMMGELRYIFAHDYTDDVCQAVKRLLELRGENGSNLG